MAKDPYAQHIFDFFEKINSTLEEDQIKSAIIEEMESFGFEYVTIWTIPPPGNPLKGILLNTRPDDYVEHYIEKNLVLRDPVVTHLRRTIRPYSWSDVRASVNLTSSEKRIMDEAKEWDVQDGMTIPIVTATGSLAIVSPCGRSPDLSVRARAAVEMIGVMGHQALKRSQLNKYIEQEPYEPLTVREREIFQLIAFGKTDGEIAEILNVRSTTVLAHVENAKRKLGAAKRPLAVVVALRRGELSF